MRKRFTFLVLVFLFTLEAAAAAEAKQWIVGTVGDPARSAAFGKWGGRNRPFEMVRGYTAELTEEQAAALRNSPEVRYVEPDYEVRVLGSVNPLLTWQGELTPWGVKAIGALALWPQTLGARIGVAIIDTGMDCTHPDLRSNCRGGYDWVNNDSIPADDFGHGSHVGGIVGGALNGLGIVGVAPLVDLYAHKVIGADGKGKTSDVVRAIEQVTLDDRVHIANISLGSSGYSEAEAEACAKARAAGKILVASAGNDGDSTPNYPASFADVISVGAIDESLRAAYFSNRGGNLQLTAPGVNIMSDYIMGEGSLADVELPNGAYKSWRMAGGPIGEKQGAIVYCGRGWLSQWVNSFPEAIKGNIALIERGDLYFYQKAQNAKDAGAVAAIIYNNVPGAFQGSFGDSPVDLLTVCVSREDGLKLLEMEGLTVTVNVVTTDYAEFSGTSMAAPHVAGAIALLWSLFPNASSETIRNAILLSAHDLGPRGWDEAYGYGLVDLPAAKAFMERDHRRRPAAVH